MPHSIFHTKCESVANKNGLAFNWNPMWKMKHWSIKTCIDAISRQKD